MVMRFVVVVRMWRGNLLSEEDGHSLILVPVVDVVAHQGDAAKESSLLADTMFQEFKPKVVVKRCITK
jgi:hypothetical protein